MVVNSLAFLAFVALAAILYYVVPKKFQYIFLLIASYSFYMLAGVGNIGCLLLATVVTWAVTCSLEAGRQKRSKKGQKAILVIGIVVVLSILLCSKMGSFIAPLGVSYFSLQAIGYMLDAHKGRVKPEKNILKAALFMGYFPQITQGPIGRFKELSPQLYEERKFNYDNLRYGCQRILIGFFKKTVIADRLNPLVKDIFSNYAELSGFTIVLGCIYMTFQLYADFAAYSDIVCGVSRIFGIRLRENFTTPFFSTSFPAYWRCWHISLSSWFRDYVFYPLSISKTATKLGKWTRKRLPKSIAKLTPIVFATAFVWLGTGLWHEISVQYLIWGLANGGVMIVSLYLEPLFVKCKEKLHLKDENKAFHCFRILRTFAIVALLKVFPAASSPSQSFVMIGKIFTDFSFTLSREAIIPGWYISSLLITLFGLAVFFVISLLEYRSKGIDNLLERFSNRNVFVRWAVYMVLFVGVLWFGEFGSDLVGGFEYAQY